MATLDLNPMVFEPSTSWTDIPYIVGADSYFCRCVSGSTDKLYMEFYPGTHTNSLVPLDSVINGIQIFYVAKASGAASGMLEFNIYNTDTRTPLGSALYSPLLNYTAVTSSVGYPHALTLNHSTQWIDINNLTNGRPAGNRWFGLYVKAASPVAAELLIDSLYLRIHYTSYNYLVGSRTKFHLERPDLGYDVVMVNGVANNASSYIPRRDNGTDQANQVKSLDVNYLGDSLYNIESALLNASGSVYAIDLEKTYVFSITLSAFINSSSVNTSAVVYAKIRHNGTEYSNSVNIFSPNKTVAPNVSDTINCHFTSAIAWTEDPLGITKPLYASAQGARFSKTNSGIDYVVGFTALASSLGTVVDYETLETSPGGHQGYIGSHFTAAPASGKIFVKIMSIGRES